MRILWSMHIADLVASKREKGLSEALKAKRGFDNEFDLITHLTQTLS